MSAIQKSQNIWPNLSKETLDSKYEKCRNITEEIYKRINITFQIKKLETAVQSDISDHSDQIDSNELSNETDLFACDKSDSIPSSDDKPDDKYLNNNNNNEERLKKPVAVYKRPRKRFRKRVKKHQQQTKPQSDSDDSDSALPLSRIVDIDTTTKSRSESPERVMGVPNIVIRAKDLKKISPDKKADSDVQTEKMKEKTLEKVKDKTTNEKIKEKPAEKVKEKTEDKKNEFRSCDICSMSFRGERGLRRHMAMSHIVAPDLKRREEREVNPA